MGTNSYGLDFDLPSLPYIEHFLTSCLIQGYDFLQAIALLKEVSNPRHYASLLSECIYVLTLDNRDFIIEYGIRLGIQFTDDSLEYLLKLIISELSSTAGDKMR